MRKLDYLLFGFLIIIIFYLIYPFNNFEKYPDEFEQICLENCKKINGINFNWDLMNYNINETYNFIECKCVRKSRDSVGYNQGVGIDIEILYFDLNTSERLSEEEIFSRVK